MYEAAAPARDDRSRCNGGRSGRSVRCDVTKHQEVENIPFTYAGRTTVNKQ